MAEMGRHLGAEALPTAHGGNSLPPTPEWIRQRLDNFPLMHLDKMLPTPVKSTPMPGGTATAAPVRKLAAQLERVPKLPIAPVLEMNV